MPSEWRELTWGDIATLEYGRGLSGYEQSPGRFTVFGTNGPIGRNTEALCSHPTVVIGRKGAYRGVHYSPEPCYVIDTAFYLEPKVDLDMRWAYYQLLTLNINSMDSGSAIPSTSRGDFYSLPVRFPSLPVQHSIAHILGALDDKIELNRRMNETLEQMARAIFKSWFVDFEPFRDKGMVDSPLGKIPKGWEIKTLGDVANVVKGRSYSSDELQPSKVALVTLKSFSRGGGYRVDGLKSFTGEYKPEQAIRPGEVVISFTDVTQAAEVIGRPAIVRASSDYDTMVASLDVGIIRPKHGKLPAPFFYCLLSAQDFTDHILGYVNGTTVLHLDKQGIPSYRFACPPPYVAQAYADVAVPAFARIDANETESRTLAAIRDTLLPKLMTGEIRTNGLAEGLEEQR
jgi:type I restriction enzyme S subunit